MPCIVGIALKKLMIGTLGPQRAAGNYILPARWDVRTGPAKLDSDISDKTALQ